MIFHTKRKKGPNTPTTTSQLTDRWKHLLLKTIINYVVVLYNALAFFQQFRSKFCSKKNKTNFDYIFQARSRSSPTNQPTVIENIQTNKQCNYDRRSLCQQRGVTLYSYQVRPLCAKTNKQTLNCNCSSVKHWFRYVISFFSTPGPPFKKAHAQQLPSLVLNRLLNQTSTCADRAGAPRTRPTGTP